MSQETMETLNSTTLIGHTSTRGNAWHYRADLQGDEPNHYPQAVPVDDVLRRLFSWSADESPVRYQVPCDIDATDLAGIDEYGRAFAVRVDGTKKVIFRSDTGAALGVHSDGYQPHQYSEWLVKNVSNLLDDDLSIGSAGLLAGGAVAWVQVDIAETMTTPSGLVFKPNLTAVTSCNGRLATTYQRMQQVVVCDNTLFAGLGERGQRVKVKHTSRSAVKIGDARDALGLILSQADAFTETVESLVNVSVSDADLGRFLDLYVPVPADDGRGKTLAEGKRSALTNLWRNDVRVAPWSGSAFGLLQMTNTYAHHVSNIRGVERAERNMLSALDGTTAAGDSGTLATMVKAGISLPECVWN